MTKATNLLLILTIIQFIMVTTGSYYGNLPISFGNILVVFSFMILGFMLGMVILLPKSAFKEVIKQ